MDSWERTKFKFRLERERRGTFSFLCLPLLLTAAALIACTVLAHNVSALAGVLAVAVTLLGFGGFAATVWGLMTDPFKRALAGYTADPSYEEQLGFTAEADADIRLLTRMLTEDDNRALVVFVDDLDRCSPRHVVEAIKAINQIFNAGEDSRCVFILGMDRDLIAAAIKVAYADTVAELSKERQPNFGLHFLAKLVQLLVAVPAPGPEGIERLLASIGERDPSTKPPASPPAEVPVGPDVLPSAGAEPSARSPSEPGTTEPDPYVPSSPDGGSSAEYGGEDPVDQSSPQF